MQTITHLTGTMKKKQRKKVNSLGRGKTIPGKPYTVYKRIAPDGRMYIGMTSKSVEWRAGKNGIRYLKHRVFGKAIREIGWENFKTEIVAENLTREAAERLEKSLISVNKTTDIMYGFNAVSGGIGAKDGGTYKKGHIPWNVGIKWQSDEAISKRIKRAAEVNRGKHFSNEQRNNIRRAIGSKKLVTQYTLDGEYVATYISCHEASRITGAHFQDVGKCASGKAKTHMGYIWRFAEEGDTE